MEEVCRTERGSEGKNEKDGKGVWRNSGKDVEVVCGRERVWCRICVS